MSIDTGLRPAGAGRNIPLGSLRAFVTLLVVAHHAALAYHPYAPPPAASLTAAPRFWMAFPIVDAAHWQRADLFVGFNDVFFMSLMFFVSGMFAWPSLVRRGAGGFARERAIKLGVPFLASAALFAPLAYSATYAASAPNPQAGSFVHQWLSLGVWPAGPAWFLWVLLAFGLLAAALYAVGPSWGATLGRLSGRLSRAPITYAAALMAASAAVYLPMAAAFTPEAWLSVGPFFAQTSRLLHYGVYFFAGAGLGAYGLREGLLAADGTLARRWWLWGLGSLLAYFFAIVMFIVIVSTLEKGGPGLVLSAVGNLSFVVSCAFSSMAFVAIFVRFGQKANRAWLSVSDNAYGIYLVHYFCVSWLQLSLLGVPFSGFAKFAIVLIGAVAVSWSLSAALRRIPVVARVV